MIPNSGCDMIRINSSSYYVPYAQAIERAARVGKEGESPAMSDQAVATIAAAWGRSSNELGRPLLDLAARRAVRRYNVMAGALEAITVMRQGRFAACTDDLLALIGLMKWAADRLENCPVCHEAVHGFMTEDADIPDALRTRRYFPCGHRTPEVCTHSEVW